jgi:hypothetical protein
MIAISFDSWFQLAAITIRYSISYVTLFTDLYFLRNLSIVLEDRLWYLLLETSDAVEKYIKTRR